MLLALPMGMGYEAGHGNEAMDCSVEGFGGEACVLPLHFAGGGPEIGVRAGGEGKIPGVHADAGELHRLPGGGLLFDVQSATNGGLKSPQMLQAVGKAEIAAC
jgi:hypothetical protein